MNGFEPLISGEKVIPASANKPYPAIFCFARKTSGVVQIEKDQALHLDVKSYIVRSQAILDEIERNLKAALAGNKGIIVWGTGQLTMKLLAQTSLAKADIIAFVDSNPINQGKVIKGTKVLSPNEIRGYSEPILISSTLHQQSIAQQIDKMNLNNRLIFLRDE
jgi:FlaA1/EpsC-like NDP-sugar epimerase